MNIETLYKRLNLGIAISYIVNFFFLASNLLLLGNFFDCTTVLLCLMLAVSFAVALYGIILISRFINSPKEVNKISLIFKLLGYLLIVNISAISTWVLLTALSISP